MSFFEWIYDLFTGGDGGSGAGGKKNKGGGHTRPDGPVLD